MMKEFSIKGAAGPYVVVGSNFAPGTTSADIQSTMEIVAGEMVSCAIITSYPTVMAEMVFQDRTCADKVVTTFNNQKVGAIGPCRVLLTCYRGGWPSSTRLLEERSTYTASRATATTRTSGYFQPPSSARPFRSSQKQLAGTTTREA